MRAYFFTAVAILMAFCLLTTPITAQKQSSKTNKVSAEMRDFMKQLDGKEEHVNAALKKYAAEGVDTTEMSYILVSNPKITKTETKEGMTCYTMACKTGLAERVYLICWKDKKIQKVKQLSMRLP